MGEVFPIVPATPKVLWLLAPVAVVILGVASVLGYTWYESRHTTFELSPAGLQIRGSMYGRTIPLHALVGDAARALDLDRELDYRPRWRTFGTGLPGYSAGWFRLRNREKALLFVTDRHRTVYVPTRDGYAVLLSVPDPDRFVAALRQLSG